MSTHFISRTPKSAADLEALGWIVDPDDPDVYMCGENYCEFYMVDGHLGVRWGDNDLEALYDPLELVSEHDALYPWLYNTRVAMQDDREVFWQEAETSEPVMTIEEHVAAIESALPLFVNTAKNCTRLTQAPLQEVRMLGLARMKQLKRSK